MSAWYNEIDPYCAQWLRNLIADGQIAPGVVDTRSIADVQPDDIMGFDQCHFFAGAGGWSIALRIAGWPDDKRVWTASAPCQPYSIGSDVWGKGKAQQDERHLWPHVARLKRECRPPTIFGEQVKEAIAYGWLDDVFHDFEEDGYACGSATLTGYSVGAPDKGERLYFIATTDGTRGAGLEPGRSAGAIRQGWPGCQADMQSIFDAPLQPGHSWPKPIIRRMDDGVFARTHKLRAYGNSINPYEAARFIEATE